MVAYPTQEVGEVIWEQVAKPALVSGRFVNLISCSHGVSMYLFLGQCQGKQEIQSRIDKHQKYRGQHPWN